MTDIDTSTTPRNMNLDDLIAYANAVREESTIKITDDMSHLEIAKACVSGAFNQNPIRDDRTRPEKSRQKESRGRLVWLSKFNDQDEEGNPVFVPYSLNPTQTYTRSVGRNIIKRRAREMVKHFKGTDTPLTYSQAKGMLNLELERIKARDEEKNDDC